MSEQVVATAPLIVQINPLSAPSRAEKKGARRVRIRRAPTINLNGYGA